MNNSSKLNKYRTELLDVDGSCRDINFSLLSTSDCRTIVGRIFSKASSCNLNNSDEKEIPFDSNSFVNAAINSSYALAHLENVADLFTSFQCFLSQDESNFFLELTFFPNDISQKNDPLWETIRFIRYLCVDTSVSEYFLRYENASWKLGDKSPGSGVIFTSSDVENVF